MASLTVQLRKVTGNRVREKGSDTQQMVRGRTLTRVRCSEDRASVPDAALPAELNGAPVICNLKCIHSNYLINKRHVQTQTINVP